MADYDLTKDVEKRLRYFDGQFLKEQDFIDEQRYFLDRQWRYGRFLNVTGIVDGLEVTPGTAQVTVAPGTALDRQGRQIVLSRDRQAAERSVPLDAYKGQTVNLVIAYQQKESDEQQVEAGSAGARRFWETPYLGPDSTLPSGVTTADTVLLTRLTIDANGAITKDDTVRLYAGVHVPDGTGTGQGPTLRVSGTGASLTFKNVDASQAANGITWYTTTPTNYGIHRTAGTWTAPNYQQLRLGWLTGIILDPGTQYGKSYVDIQGNGLRVTSGNVGIGTTGSGAKLEVAVAADDANTKPLVVGKGTSNYLTILNDGKVGIGTTEPKSPLSVAEGLAVGATYAKTNAAPANGLLVEGKVGIGATSPEANLEISGNADTSGQVSLQLRSGNRATNYESNQITFGFNNTAQYRHTIKTRHHSRQRAGNAIDFYVWQYGTESGAADRIGGLHTMTLDGGNVGIGTTDPGTDRLKVDGTLNVTGASTFTTVQATAVTTTGTIKSDMWRVTPVMQSAMGPLPKDGTFETRGGTVLIVASGAGDADLISLLQPVERNDLSTMESTIWEHGHVPIGMEIWIDDKPVGTARAFTPGNFAGNPSPQAFTATIYLNQLPSGSHRLKLNALTTRQYESMSKSISGSWFGRALDVETATDGHQFNVTIIEFPF